jgi:hypothetical protein
MDGWVKYFIIIGVILHTHGVFLRIMSDLPPEVVADFFFKK